MPKVRKTPGFAKRFAEMDAVFRQKGGSLIALLEGDISLDPAISAEDMMHLAVLFDAFVHNVTAHIATIRTGLSAIKGLPAPLRQHMEQAILDHEDGIQTITLSFLRRHLKVMSIHLMFESIAPGLNEEERNAMLRNNAQLLVSRTLFDLLSEESKA